MVDFGKARADFAEDFEEFLVEEKTKVLAKGKKRKRPSLRESLRKRIKPRVTTYMQAHMTNVLPDIHSSPTLKDVNRTDRWHIYSSPTQKVETTSQDG